MRGGLVWRSRMIHDSHSSFSRRSFFARLWHSLLGCVRGVFTGRDACATTARMRWTGQIFWLLAFGPASAGRTFIPPSPPKVSGIGPWDVVSSYSSATAPDSHGISCADPLFQARKELIPQVAACAWRFKIYLIITQQVSCAYD